MRDKLTILLIFTYLDAFVRITLAFLQPYEPLQSPTLVKSSAESCVWGVVTSSYI